MNPKEELHSKDMETALVATALMDGGVFDVSGVQPEHFQNVVCRKVWRAIGELRQTGAFVDSVTVLDRLDAHESGVTLADMANIAATDANVNAWETYAKRVKADAIWREVGSLGVQAVKVSHAPNGNGTADVAALIAKLTAVHGRLTEHTAERAKPVTRWSAAELLAASFPEPVWAVPGYVPVGLTVLAGRPKVGKSWLALQIAIAKGSGGIALDQRLTAGKVLYLALEDNGRRLQDRTRKQGMPASATIHFETTWPRLTNGGLDLLARTIDAEGYTFVVLDTIGRALGRVDTNDYGDTTDVIGGLQEIAIARDIAILVIDHTRKPIAGLQSDPVDDIIGSTGKSGAVDAVMSLTKTQGKSGVVLSVTGREVIQESYALAWDALTCTWQLEGTAEQIELQGRRGLVLATLQDAYPEALTAGEIAKDASMHREKVIPLLNDLVTSGHVTRETKRGKEQPYRAVQGKAGV